jgi:RNA recognition motif-containing protein
MCNREQDKEATVYIGNIDERVTDSLIWELMLQAGRIVNVHLPKDRVTQSHQGYGFVEFISEEDAEYAARIMNQVRLYGKPIRVNKVRLQALTHSIAHSLCSRRDRANKHSRRPQQTNRKPPK